ncbi:MAG: response regulator transcription factor [Spirochaetales bacterium]|nr:response regulator transcription factor [Spirochaetales bacterium]
MIDPFLCALFTDILGPREGDTVLKGRVLIIEDDRDIADLIGVYLKRDGIETTWREDGESGLAALAELEIDLVVLDINLPGMDGYEVLQDLRKNHDLPVIIVSARQEDEDAIMGFGMGADDYVQKPFSPKVLTARIRSHLSRFRKSAEIRESAIPNEKLSQDGLLQSDGLIGGERVYQFGPFVLDGRAYSLLRENKRISLSPREIELLLFLAENRGRPQSQEDLFQQVWGRRFGDISTVSVHVQRIRKKIEEDPSNPQWLKTFYGRGYYLAAEEGE